MRGRSLDEVWSLDWRRCCCFCCRGCCGGPGRGGESSQAYSGSEGELPRGRCGSEESLKHRGVGDCWLSGTVPCSQTGLALQKSRSFLASSFPAGRVLSSGPCCLQVQRGRQRSAAQLFTAPAGSRASDWPVAAEVVTRLPPPTADHTFQFLTPPKIHKIASFSENWAAESLLSTLAWHPTTSHRLAIFHPTSRPLHRRQILAPPDRASSANRPAWLPQPPTGRPRRPTSTCSPSSPRISTAT